SKRKDGSEGSGRNKRLTPRAWSCHLDGILHLRRCESLPDMAGTFGISQDQASWILTTYISALLFGVPLSIWMAGRVGYLHYIIGSTIVFAVASVGCAAAPDFQTFLLSRAVQGFAGAGLTMWWRAGVYILMTGPQRSTSMMRISVMLYLATAVGLLFCGYGGRR
ncbi:MAG: MFS transporter, partial [Xanthobacteraceae bacterium]